jgi:hypothetical protein
MAAVSYTLVAGGVLENVVTGTNAPSAGVVEIRMDQTAAAITDGNGGSRILRKGEIFSLINILTQYLVRDTAVVE